MERKQAVECLRYLVELSGELERAFFFVERKQVNPDVSEALADMIHDVRACVLDAREICKQTIFEVKAEL